MNFYILTEDEKSLKKVLPEWLKYLDFKYTRVDIISEIKDNNYILQSGQGIYQLIDRVLFETIDTIVQYDLNINYLIVILDAESCSVEDRIKEVNDKINKKYCDITFKFKIKIIVCDCCFETWLLCNSKLYPDDPPTPDNSFYKFYTYYNVKDLDPENMEKSIIPFENTQNTKAGFHFNYLHEMCKYNNITYRKNKPEISAAKDFFDELIKRTNTTKHGKSFKYFCDYIKSLNK